MGWGGKGRDGDGVGAHPHTHMAVKGRWLGCVHLYPNLKGGQQEGERAREGRGVGQGGAWYRCAHSAPMVARRWQEVEMEMAKEGARDRDGLGVHPRTHLAPRGRHPGKGERGM